LFHNHHFHHYHHHHHYHHYHHYHHHQVMGPTRMASLFQEQQIQQWHNAYVEQLMSLRLFVVASDVMIHAGKHLTTYLVD